jgi:nucleoid DNA-binding protein
MNKAQLIEAIARDSGLTKVESKRALESMLNNIQKRLKKREEVRLVGFGTFSVKDRKARKGINPRTGEPIKIKARRVPHFSPGAELKKGL